jgi:predicted  nucleic acid-binding Zn-ribbon protein
MEAVDALKGIHEIGVYNALISFILVIILCITFLELLQKIKSIMGIKFKGDLEKETLDNKLIELETRLKMQEENIQKYNNDLFEKQKKYHAESIEIRNGLKQDQDNLSDQISELNQMMNKLNNNFVKKEISDMRTTLLDFANAIMNDRDYNREQYEHILDVYQDYENVLEENHMDNGRVTRSMEYVKKNYDYLIEHGFKK